MHTVAMVMNDVLVGAPTGEASDRKGPAGREDEERGQRFADMLPLGASKENIRPDNNDVEQVSTANGRRNTQTAVDADKPKGRTAQDDGGTLVVGIDPARWEVPGRPAQVPKAAKADAGKGPASHTERSEAPHYRSSQGNRISADPQVTSEKELTASKVGVSSTAGTARQAKGPGYASGPVAGTGMLVRPESPKVPGRAATGPTMPGTGQGAEMTATPAALKVHSDGIAGLQVQITGSKDPALSAPVPGNGTKEASPKGPKDGLTVRTEAAPASASETVTSSLRPSIPAQGGAAGAASGSLARDVGEQILDSIHASLARGDRQITIRLRPPELGTVLVRFREDGEHITGLLEVGKSDIRHEIEQALPQVLRSLQDAGVQIRRFEVVTSDPSQRDLARDQMQQDAWPHQRGSGQDRDPPQMASQTHRAPSGAGHPTGPHDEPNAPQQGVTAHGRINLLL